MTLLLGFGSLLVLWQGSRAVVGGRITLGEFVAFNAYLVMLSWPMIAFGWVTNILQRGMASWKRMLEVLDVEPDINDKGVTEAGRRLVIEGGIDFRDVVFRYPGSERIVLDHVSLSIEAGQTVAFVGATGSGKSTLISLLPRLHEPPRGSVFIDGVDVLDIPLETSTRGDWVRAAGAVPLLGYGGREHRASARRTRREVTGASASRDAAATWPDSMWTWNPFPRDSRR